MVGLEDVTTYFHFGLAEAMKKNPVAERGCPTVFRLNPEAPLVVNYIMGVARIPRGFGRVRNIAPAGDGRAALGGEQGKPVVVPLDTDFLREV